MQYDYDYVRMPFSIPLVCSVHGAMDSIAKKRSSRRSVSRVNRNELRLSILALFTRWDGLGDCPCPLFLNLNSSEA